MHGMITCGHQSVLAARFRARLRHPHLRISVMLEGLGIESSFVVVFACGALSGVAVGALASRGVFARAGTRAVMRRVDGLELRIAQLQDYQGRLHSAVSTAEGLPRVAGQALAHLSDLVPQPRGRFASRAEPARSRIGEDLAESLRVNIEAAIDAGDAVAANKHLEDPDERRLATRAVKRAGNRLDTSFWDRNASLIRSSALSDRLKAKLRDFYECVDELKEFIEDLPAVPPISSLIRVVEDVVALLNVASDIADELRKLVPNTIPSTSGASV